MDILKKVLLASVLVFPLYCSATDIVDINVADKETLMSIKGIGEKRASAIIAYRDQHGQFKSVDDLTDVQGVSESLVLKSRALLTVKAGK